MRATGRRGAGAPPSEARDPKERATGRRGAGAPPSEAREPNIARAKPALGAEHLVVGGSADALRPISPTRS
jgi:hypothetical protein